MRVRDTYLTAPYLQHGFCLDTVEGTGRLHPMKSVQVPDAYCLLVFD